MGKLKVALFLLGGLLCLFPIVSRMITKHEEQEVICEYRENQSTSESIGIIEIPVIDVCLPVYSGTTEDVLKKGIGHLEGSSELGGGRSTHSILVGHRGLPNAELFTRLGEMEEGDLFYLEIHNEKLTYKVCRIQVVDPDNPKGLEIQAERDLVSLVTCTPYGLNTHRLIVTGERMEEKE